jgi:16S rRNA C1402 (ribose-2'-O) methylase RsmI
VGNIQKKILNKEINLKGEFVLVIEGAKTKPKQSLDISVENKTKRLLEKFTLTEAVEIVHKLTNISKKEVYKMALKLKND